MASRANSPCSQGHGGGLRQPVKYLVIGRDMAARLGQLLARFFRGRGDKVDRLLVFDFQRCISVYQVSLTGGRHRESSRQTSDIVIGLTNSSLALEGQLRKNGTFLLDGSQVTIRPQRDDVETITVPTMVLASAALGDSPSGSTDGVYVTEMQEAAMLGAALSVSSTYPQKEELARLFGKWPENPIPPLLLAVYRGYDWVQEREVRGKSLEVETIG